MDNEWFVNFMFSILILLNILNFNQVSKRQALQWCEQHNKCPYFETSAKNAVHVDEAFKQAALMALQRRPDESAMPYELLFMIM
jgi:hypothetical protein